MTLDDEGNLENGYNPEREGNKQIIRKLNKQGWMFYSNYINPDLLQERIKDFESKGKQCMTSDFACNTNTGRTLPNAHEVVSLWYR